MQKGHSTTAATLMTLLARLPDGLLPMVGDFDGGGPLVRVHPDDDAYHTVPFPRDDHCRREGSATLSWEVPS
jgi:hypothetical protein